MGGSYSTYLSSQYRAASFAPEEYDPYDYKDIPKEDLYLSPADYPSGGLYYPLHLLMNLYPDIIYKDQRDQMKYVDAITKRYCLNPHFRSLQLEHLKNVPDIIVINRANATSIANLAFMAYHENPKGPYDKIYQERMALLKDHLSRN